MFSAGTYVLAVALTQAVTIEQAETLEPSGTVSIEITNGMSHEELTKYLKARRAHVAMILNGTRTRLIAIPCGVEEPKDRVVFFLFDGLYRLEIFNGDTSISSSLDETGMQLEFLRQQIDAVLRPR